MIEVSIILVYRVYIHDIFQDCISSQPNPKCPCTFPAVCCKLQISHPLSSHVRHVEIIVAYLSVLSAGIVKLDMQFGLNPS